MIRSITKLAIGSFVLYLAVHLIRVGFFGDIVPIGFEQEPQTSWRVQIAFILMSVELMGAGVLVLTALFLAGAVVLRNLRKVESGLNRAAKDCRAHVVNSCLSDKPGN